MRVPDRRVLLDRDPDLSIRRQCRLLGIARSSVYQRSRPANDNDLRLMRRLDERFTPVAVPGLAAARPDAAGGWPFDQPRADAWGSPPLGPRRARPSGHRATRCSPICCAGLAIERSNQVWAADITYIPIGRGFLYLVAIIDWASRAVLNWRLSNTMDSSFCVEALEEALARFGRPEIFNTTRAASSPAPPSSAC